ncbi:MAG: viroplasmin family protein, partial [Muribaculaceae bacterium]|nr:viroplasmin family protein [Muribaculaceae bacterium]
MAEKKRKFYVVWVGRVPGIYDNWDDCQEQVAMFPGAKYKSFDSQTAATIAFRGNGEEEESVIRAIADHRPSDPGDYALIPEINLSAIAVDGACSRNPGPMEYRGVEVATGREIFHFGPVPDGTNNVAEYLALVHALA